MATSYFTIKEDFKSEILDLIGLATLTIFEENFKRKRQNAPKQRMIFHTLRKYGEVNVAYSGFTEKRHAEFLFRIQPGLFLDVDTVKLLEKNWYLTEDQTTKAAE